MALSAREAERQAQEAADDALAAWKAHLEEHRCGSLLSGGDIGLNGDCDKARELARAAVRASTALGLTRFVNDDEEGL